MKQIFNVLFVSEWKGKKQSTDRVGVLSECAPAIIIIIRFIYVAQLVKHIKEYLIIYA